MATEQYLGRKASGPEEDNRNRELFKKGFSIHSDAGTRSVLKELTDEILAPHFRDVQIFNPRLNEENDATSISSSWNIRIGDRLAYDDTEVLTNRVTVEAHPETGDLVIRGAEETRLDNSIWRSDPHQLKDAIGKAINNPMTVSNSAWTL